MKRFISCCLLAAVLFGLTACASETSAPESTAATEAVLATEAVPVTTEGATVPTEEPIDPGFLYLTVSGITFSVVGESEDIYIGTIPREKVTWVSEDENVVTFQDGVLTATGVGETTVYCEYNGKRIESKAGCLAQDPEALALVDMEIIRTPKRLPPAVSDETPTWFDDTAIIGDSITFIMFQWHTRNGGLGSPIFMSRGGAGINGLVQNYKPITYKGREMPVEDALSQSGVKKVFIMLGQNDLSYMSIEQTMEKWQGLLDRIRPTNPDLEIYFESVIPEWEEDDHSNEKNEKIDEHNILLKAFAEENGCHYVDVAAYVEDHANKMATVYSMDRTIHMNDAGSTMWVQLLKAYSEYQILLEGE